jgi:hypothetical protein
MDKDQKFSNYIFWKFRFDTSPRMIIIILIFLAHSQRKLVDLRLLACHIYLCVRTNSSITKWIFMKTDIIKFYSNLFTHSFFNLNLTTYHNNGPFLWKGTCVFKSIWSITHETFVEAQNVFAAKVVERNKTHILCSVYFFMSLPRFETVKQKGV